MLLTSKEQAMLCIAVDRYIEKASPAMCDTSDMWCELYDAIIGADIDDVGDEYDPFDDLCEFCGTDHSDFDDFDDYDDYDYEESEEYQADEEAFRKWLVEAIAKDEAQAHAAAQEGKDRFNTDSKGVDQPEPEQTQKISQEAS
jgi:hypothetical protein